MEKKELGRCLESIRLRRPSRAGRYLTYMIYDEDIVRRERERSGSFPVANREYPDIGLFCFVFVL